MQRADPFEDEASLQGKRSSQTAERDEFQRSLASSLILRQADGAVRTPVVTLCTERTCVYNVLEKHLRAEALVGTDRWWRICKSLYRPPLEVMLRCRTGHDNSSLEAHGLIAGVEVQRLFV